MIPRSWIGSETSDGDDVAHICQRWAPEKPNCSFVIKGYRNKLDLMSLKDTSSAIFTFTSQLFSKVFAFLMAVA